MRLSTIKVHFTLVSVTILTVFGMAQSDIQLGEWEAHLPYQRSEWVTQSNSFVYLSTGAAIVKINKQELEDNELLNPEFITKIDGLSETSIDKVLYDQFNNQLIITYKSSNIDVVRGDEVINIPFIKDNGTLIGSRTINDLHIVDATTCYLASAFGVINMDLQKLEFRFTTFTNEPALTITSNATNLYMGSEEGLYEIALDDSNPIDFSRWKLLSGSNGLPALYSCTNSQEFDGSVYVVIDGDLYRQEGDQFIPFEIDRPSGYAIQFLSADQGNLMVGLKNATNFKSEIRRVTPTLKVDPGGADCINDLIYGIESESGKMWYADGFRGIRYTDGYNFGCQVKSFNSPRSAECSQIEVKKDQVFFASGGASDNFALLSNREGIYVLDQNNWTNINEREYPVINDSFFINFVSVAPHPKENKVWMSSYWAGIVEFDLDSEEFRFFDADNSGLKGVNTGDKRARVAYATFDDDENLWMANFGSPEPIVAYLSTGSWHSFDIPYNNTNLAKMAIDQNGYIWYTIVGNNGGVLVYDPGESIPDPNDDRYKVLTANDLPSSLVFSLAVDLDNNVWVGTNQGPVVFECDVFNTSCGASEKIVTQDGIQGLLLNTEEVLSIEVDGANRKWFGTKNGIFVQSPSADEQIEQFTIDNSPLFNNTIVDMDFNPKDGRMYISTNEGVQSFRTETTGAQLRHDEANVYAFPNPVTPEYSGPIAIKGLGRDANVKITDLNGKLVYETEALGGQAIWDGRDYTGRKAAAGIYLVFSSSRVSFDTSDEFVTKIMFID